MLISVLMISTLKLELISRNIFNKSYNTASTNIEDIIDVGSYSDIMNIKNDLIIKEDSIYNDVKFLHISIKNTNYNRFRIFYAK